jgi:hypothetical protein
MLQHGMARLISINAVFDSTQGGNPHLLRDGGANGAAYVHNTTGGVSYSNLILSYAARLEEPIAFDPAAGDVPRDLGCVEQEYLAEQQCVIPRGERVPVREDAEDGEPTLVPGREKAVAVQRNATMRRTGIAALQDHITR